MGIRRTVNQGHPRSIGTTSADTIEVTIEELGTSNLQTFFHDLRGELVHTVVHRTLEDMLNGTVLVVRGAVLADVLNTPVTKLSMGHVINLLEHFFNGRSL